MNGFRTFEQTGRPITGRPAMPVVPIERVLSPAQIAQRRAIQAQAAAERGRAEQAARQSAEGKRASQEAAVILEAQQRAEAAACRWPPVGLHRITAIINIVASVYRIPVRDLLGQSRFADIVRPRQVVCWLARRQGFSLPETGTRLGGRDHTTVLHGERRVQKLVEQHGIAPAEDTPAAWARAIRAVQFPSARVA